MRGWTRLQAHEECGLDGDGGRCRPLRLRGRMPRCADAQGTPLQAEGSGGESRSRADFLGRRSFDAAVEAAAVVWWWCGVSFRSNYYCRSGGRKNAGRRDARQCKLGRPRAGVGGWQMGWEGGGVEGEVSRHVYEGREGCDGRDGGG